MREITTPAHLSAFFGAICLVFALGHSGRCRSLYKPNGRSFYIHNTCIALQVYMLFARLWWHRADYVNAAALRWRATRARTRLIYSVIMSWYVVSSTILSACTCVVLCVFCSMCHAWRAALVARREFPIHSGMAYQQRYQFVIAVAVKDFLENVKSTSAHSWTVRAAHCLKHDTKNKMKRTRKKKTAHSSLLDRQTKHTREGSPMMLANRDIVSHVNHGFDDVRREMIARWIIRQDVRVLLFVARGDTM